MELTRDIGKGTPEKGTEMATTQVGQIEYQVPCEFYGDFVEDFDTEAVNAALLARLNEQMPKGVGVAANGMVFAEFPLTVSSEEIVAAIAVAMEDIDVNEIIAAHELPPRTDVADVIEEALAAYLDSLLWSSGMVWVGSVDIVSVTDVAIPEGDLWGEFLRLLTSECGSDAREDLTAMLADADDDEVLSADAEAYIAARTVGDFAHDFALTRNRHGAGFWDRGLGDIGARLTEAAHAYGDSAPTFVVDREGFPVSVHL